MNTILKTREAQFTEGDDEKIIIVTFGINHTNHSYWSITANIGRRKKGRVSDPLIDSRGKTWEFEKGGCCHDEVLRIFPDLKIFINLHLSNIDGVPMHYIENGFYHFCRDLQVAAEHLRVPLAELEQLKKDRVSKSDFCTYLEGKKERWRKEAEKVKELLRSY